LIAAALVGAALGAGTTLVLRREPHRVAATATAPDKSRVATAREKPCGEPGRWCSELSIGPSRESGTVVAAYDDPAVTCDEIVWTPDGKRVGFVMRGRELRLFDPVSLREIGLVRLVTDEAAQTRRARGVTFSENGRAVTFDDCPRGQSGCRAGVVGIPQ
jgi:hypothetical protein